MELTITLFQFKDQEALVGRQALELEALTVHLGHATRRPLSPPVAPLSKKRTLRIESSAKRS